METKEHKAQPSADLLVNLKPLNPGELQGIKIAAYICRMYGDGGRWAEAIESYGEQQRARYWMLVDTCQTGAEGNTFARTVAVRSSRTGRAGSVVASIVRTMTTIFASAVGSRNGTDAG